MSRRFSKILGILRFRNRLPLFSKRKASRSIRINPVPFPNTVLPAEVRAFSPAEPTVFPPVNRLPAVVKAIDAFSALSHLGRQHFRQEIQQNNNAQCDPIPTEGLKVMLFDKVHQELNDEDRNQESDDHANGKGEKFGACEV